MKCSLNPRVIVIVFLLVIINLNTQSVYAQLAWSPDMRITWDPAADWYPSITQNRSDGKIWVAWYSYRIGNDAEIFYKVYDPSQVHPWSTDTRLTFTSGADLAPSIMQAADGRIWVVWATNRTGNFEVYYNIYDGTSWSSDTQLPILPEPNSAQYVPYPSILQAMNGTILVFWTSNRTGNREIFCKTSNDNGATWSDDTLLTAISSPADDDWDPSVTQTTDGKIWLAWTKNYDIYFTFYDGVTWQPAAPVTTSSGWDSHPSVTPSANGGVWFFWDSDRSGDQYDVYYNSFDGTSWTGTTPLTSDPGGDFMSSAMRASDGNMWVVWTSNRQSLDIYYKTTLVPLQHDVAVFSVTPSTNVVAQGKIVSTEVVAQNHGTSTETFTVNLYANTILIGSRQIIDLAPGQLYPMNFDWSTSGAALGDYTIMANATFVTGETSTTDNTFVDGVVWVVIHDVAVVSVTASTTWGYKGYITGYYLIYVQVKNEGTISEDVTVTAYSNSVDIGIEAATIEPGYTVTLLFFIDLSNAPYGDYKLSAEASPVQDETHQSDNYLVGDTIRITIPGDLNGDRKVNLIDWSTISAHWYPGPPVGPLDYDVRSDVNQDESVNIVEVSIVSAHWGESW